MRALAIVTLSAATAHAAPCVIGGSRVSLSKIAIKTPHADLEVKVANVAAVVTATAGETTIDVSDVIAFKGAVRQKIWYAVTVHTTSGPITFERGANFIAERAAGDELIGRAVLHASDVMEGEDKPADESVGPARVRCDQLSLDWGEGAPASVAGTGTYYETRRGASIVLHGEPTDAAPGVTVSTPFCSDAGCMFFERIAQRPGWLRLAAVNESVSAVGWVRASAVTRVPADVGVGYSYGCTGDHDHAIVGRSFAPNQQHHDVTIVPGTALFTAPGGDVWARVQRKADFSVVYAPGDTWAEVIGIPGVDLGTASAYVPVAMLRSR